MINFFKKLFRPVQIVRSESWSPVSITGTKSTSWLQAYETNDRLCSILSAISEDVASVPWRVEVNGQVVDSHPLIAWMERPWVSSTGGTFFDLISLIQIWIDALGEAFLLIRRNGRKIETIPICPTYVSETPVDNGRFFLVSIPDTLTAERIAAGDMIWIRRTSALRPFGRGRGRAQCLDDPVSQDEAISKFQSFYFRNSARPDVIVFLEGLDKDPAAVQRLARQWEDRHRGIQNASRPAFLPAAGRVETIPVSLKDMSLHELRKFHRDQMYAVFRIPPEILGVVENSNRATAEAAMFIYQSGCIRPRMNFLRAVFNRWLVPLFDANAKMINDDPVRETAEFSLKKNIELYKSGVITRDECRIGQGYTPLGGELGDALSIPLNMSQSNEPEEPEDLEDLEDDMEEEDENDDTAAIQ